MNVLRKCGYPNYFSVDPRGIVGGLALGWKDDEKVTIKGHDEFFIQLKIEDQVRSQFGGNSWFTCIATKLLDCLSMRKFYNSSNKLDHII